MTETLHDLRLEDDNKNIIAKYNIYIGDIIKLIYENISEEKLNQTKYLKIISPWEDISFNYFQAKTLAEEFEGISANCKIKEDKEKIKSIVEFISKTQKHLFINFYAD
ncbi:MAG TPA: hypothetical protein VK308_03375 [Pyrinomonadaceae bacterium]|nr:hypothetical protein [Pyrinomonadaceae bacterium]